MNVASWLLWGFVATLVLTLCLVASQELRFTRVNLPYLLGTMFTPDRSRAKLVGAFVHLLNGYVFSLLYINPMPNLDPVATEIRSYRMLTERLFYVMMRMPPM